MASSAGQNVFRLFPTPSPFRGPADPGEAQFDSGLVDDDAFPRWTRILVIHNY